VDTVVADMAERVMSYLSDLLGCVRVADMVGVAAASRPCCRAWRGIPGGCVGGCVRVAWRHSGRARHGGVGDSDGMTRIGDSDGMIRIGDSGRGLGQGTRTGD
jgi:hypothetical protein